MNYCTSLTIQELVNCLIDEKGCMKRFPVDSNRYFAAKSTYDAVRDECLRRGMEPDEILRNNKRVVTPDEFAGILGMYTKPL